MAGEAGCLSRTSKDMKPTVAVEQEMRAKTQEMRAKVVEAESLAASTDWGQTAAAYRAKRWLKG